MDQLKASSEIGYRLGTGMPGGSGGNPLLDPWRANAFDLSYEKYFGSGAYVSAAGFYKDLKTYIYNQTNATTTSATCSPTCRRAISGRA